MQIKLHTIVVVALLVSSCAQHSPYTSKAQVAAPIIVNTAITESESCAALKNSSSKEVARALDMNEEMLATLRKFGKTDNAGVCAMTWDERNNFLLAYRKTIKNPNRQATRAASKEYIATWDADDNGKQPTSSQKIAADNIRRTMAAKNSTTNKNKAAGISPGQWTYIGPGNVGGRLRAIVLIHAIVIRFFIGAATGGVWVTNNAG
ncbi:MAG: hypothetical protein HC782_01960, partial [Gammaproteobacteria bacterium]|nr:hypothetical protein [Gammaproteobacteria bacterium]